MKALICFTFDPAFNAYLWGLIAELLKIDGVQSPNQKGIPLHMTIWGGIEMNCASWRERLERAAVMLRPFHGDIPTVNWLEPAQLSLGFYGLRLKLFDNDFVMTGDEQLNVAWLKFLGAEDFYIDQARHVSLVNLKTDLSLSKQALILNACNKATIEFLKSNPYNCPTIGLFPKIFIKFPTWILWQEMPLDFLRRHGIDWSSGSFKICEPEI